MMKSVCFAALTAGTVLAGAGVASAQGASLPGDPSPVRPHTVASGESLSMIALAELGVTDRWGEIFALNRHTLADPELIEVGQILDIPSSSAAVPAVEASPPSDQPPTPHTVTAGESLSEISQNRLGVSERWIEIFAVNRDTVAGPDLLHVGQVLEIPSAPVAVPADILARVATAPVAAPSRAPRASVPSSGGGGKLAAIRACESSGNYGAVSPDGLYRGAYQFDLPTWQSVGGSGDPATAAPGEQDARAGQLWSQRGSNPWPNCG